MAQLSSIEALPQEFFDEVNRALKTPGMTIERVVAHMATLGVDLSKSAVGRHKQKIDVVAEQLRKSRVIAEALGREFGEKPDDKIADLNIELLHDQLMKFLTKVEDGELVSLTTKEMREMADAMYRLSAARKSDADRMVKVRLEIAKQASKIVDEETKKEPGMSAETVGNIKRKILGLTR